MRDILTGLAIILIVALTTMLVAPYFVDWNGQRTFLETQLSRALGQKVTVGGNIDLKLLPTPYLRLNQTVIGSDDGAIRIGIRHLDLELSVAPLLHGEFDIVEGRLDEPTIRLTLQTDRNLPTLPDTPALRANVRFERMQIVDGTLAIADPQSGRTFVVDHLDFNAEAPSLAGPFRGGGTEGPSDARTKFRFSTTAANKGKAHLHLALDETLTHPSLDLDGDVSLNPIADDRVRQSFDGRIAAVGHILSATKDPIGWRLAGPIQLDPQHASFPDGELRVGSDDNGLTLPTTGTAAFGEASDLHVKLNAKQLDIDRLSGAPVDAARPPPPKLPDLATLKRLVAAVTPPLPTFVDVTVETATWGGEQLGDLDAHLSLGGPAPRPVRLSGDGPGGLHVDLRGDLADTGALGGRLDVAAEDLPSSLRWLAAVTSVRVPNDLPFRSIAMSGRLKAEADTLDLSDLLLTLDRSKLDGAAHIAVGDVVSVSANLRSKRLDLDGLPNLPALQSRTTSLDVALKLDADAIRIAQVGGAPLDARRIHLDAALKGRQIAVNAFDANDLGGSHVSANGKIDETASSLMVTVDAAHLDPIAALARQLAPSRFTDALVDRAASLSPAKLKIDGSFAPVGAARFAPTRLDVAGQVAATQVDVHLTPDAGGVVLTANVAAARGAGLLRQLGMPALPLDVIGPSHAKLAATGRLDRPLRTQIDADFGGTRVTVDGSFDILAAASRGGSGTVTLRSTDSAPLLETLALVPFDAPDRLPADLTAGLAIGGTGVAVSDLKGQFDGIDLNGTLTWQDTKGDDPSLKGSLTVGRLPLGSLCAVITGPARAAASGATWSKEPFATGVADPPRSAIALRAQTVDLGFGLAANDVSLDLSIEPHHLALKQIKGGFLGGQLTGDVSLRRDGVQVSTEGSLDLDKATVTLAPLKAAFTGKLDFAGGGASPLALASSLAGTGDARFADAVVAGVNSSALPKVFASVEDDTVAVDDDSVTRALEEASTGSLTVGPRTYTASLAGGTYTLVAKDPPVAIGPLATTLDGSLDLRRPQVDVRFRETLTDLPKNWTGPPPAITIRQVAPAGGVSRRSFEISAFINAVAARAIARESARIESYEFDIRERALFNARLDADHRREQDRLRAEAEAKAAAEAARKAEAERRTKAEAARVEKQRQDLDAKALSDQGRGGDAVPPRLDAEPAPPPDASAPNRN